MPECCVLQRVNQPASRRPLLEQSPCLTGGALHSNGSLSAEERQRDHGQQPVPAAAAAYRDGSGRSPRHRWDCFVCTSDPAKHTLSASSTYWAEVLINDLGALGVYSCQQGLQVTVVSVQASSSVEAC